MNNISDDPSVAPYAEVLEGESVSLRRLQLDDVLPQYLAFLRDPEVAHYIQARFIEHNEDSLRAFVRSFDHLDSFLFGVFPKENNQFIGTCTLRVDRVHRTSSLGYLIGNKDYWRGTTTLDMCRTLLDFAFFERGVRRILEPTTENHIASNFNFKRLGFTMAAKIPDMYWGEGRYQAATYWTLSAVDWAENRGRPAPKIPIPPRD